MKAMAVSCKKKKKPSTQQDKRMRLVENVPSIKQQSIEKRLEILLWCQCICNALHVMGNCRDASKKNFVLVSVPVIFPLSPILQILFCKTCET
jgi:hypothetical protein